MPPEDELDVGVTLDMQAWDTERADQGSQDLHRYFCTANEVISWDSNPAAALLFAPSSGETQRVLVGVISVDHEDVPMPSVLQGVLPVLIETARSEVGIASELLAVSVFTEAWQYEVGSADEFAKLDDAAIESALKVAPRTECKYVLTLGSDGSRHASRLCRDVDAVFKAMEPDKGNAAMWTVLSQAIEQHRPPEGPGAL